MQIIQRGLDVKDSCYLIYNTAVIIGFEPFVLDSE